MSQKVFEFAKELGMETISLMDKIREWKLPVKSHMAALDDDMVKEIKAKLAVEKEAAAAPAKKKKKTAKKKAAKKKTTTAVKKKTAKKKTTTKKKTARKKAGTKNTVVVTRKQSGEERAATVTMKKTGEDGATKVVSRKKAVIRRKLTPAEEIPKDETSPVEASGAEDTASESNDSSDSEKPQPRKRTNIVGRMDLSKSRPRHVAGSGTSSNDRNSRPGGPARNIRTGFFAAPDNNSTMPPTPADILERERKKERERPKKAPAAAGGKEEETPSFIAADFRKREVIFQPKKKRVVVSRADFKKTQLTTPKASKRVVKVHGTMTVSEFAQAMGQRAPAVIRKLMAAGEMVNINSSLDFETISLLAPDFGFEAENVQLSPEDVVAKGTFGNLEATPVKRPPVVTVMGHVDHGKTSLLDAIRNADVVTGEAGGITQHIGAYKVSLGEGQDVTFIDTPGHEAFTAMRARGAQVTDIAIIVVAADDGVMPQTAEAINHSKAAGVPMIIAVNKMDKEGANIEQIKQQLTEYEIVPEEWGGSHIFCPVSALQKEGIKELLEQVLLVAEMEDLKGNPERSALGTVVEARIEKGRGPMATLLVKDGTLKVGDMLVAGQCICKVKAMMNDRGERVTEALPGDPVEVLGFSEAPDAGDHFDAVKSDDVANEVVALRERIELAAKAGTEKGMTLESLFSKVKLGEVKELPIVLKADVSGSIEAVQGMLEKVNTDEVQVKVIHTAVGGISESDVLLASTANGLIIGFNVRPDTVAIQRAKEKGIEIKTYSIVYKLVDDIKAAMGGLLTPDEVEKSMGRAEVREVFSVPKLGNIGGCTVVDGKITRNDLARLVREGVVVYEGKLGSLRRFKDDAKEVASGYECGIGIENYNDIKVGDVIETYTIEKIAREL